MRKITKRPANCRRCTSMSSVTAADDMELDDTDGMMDAIDDVADTVEEIQDAVDSVDEDSVDIAKNNNISNHYIAECDECQGVFISSIVESDQDLDYVSGTCPICGKDSYQYLKWVIKDINEV